MPHRILARCLGTWIRWSECDPCTARPRVACIAPCLRHATSWLEIGLADPTTGENLRSTMRRFVVRLASQVPGTSCEGLRRKAMGPVCALGLRPWARLRGQCGGRVPCRTLVPACGVHHLCVAMHVPPERRSHCAPRMYGYVCGTSCRRGTELAPSSGGGKVPADDIAPRLRNRAVRCVSSEQACSSWVWVGLR